jgi:hypothetical protein
LVTYGSAEFQGYTFEDLSCVADSHSSCGRVSFLALYEAKGLEKGEDGILGLSPDSGSGYLGKLRQA